MNKKILSMIMAFAVALTMGLYMPAESAFAAEEQAQTETGAAVLTVKMDGETIKTFSREELEAIAAEEGSKKYSYSAWNTYPTFSTYKNIEGPTVKGILEASDMTVKDTYTVSFEGSGYKASLTGAQLNEDRFCYPNGNLVKQEAGEIRKESFEGSSAVPAAISLSGDTCLYVGQVTPNEENNPLFVKYIAKGGTIEVSTKTAERCGAVAVDQPSLSLQREGSALTISMAEGSKIDWEYDKIYYTFDTDKSLNEGWAIYNCAPKKGIVCNPVCKAGTDPDKPEYENRKVVLKIRVKGYGKQDSVLQTFTYYVGDALTVKVDGKTVKSYATQEDLEKAFGEEKASYSGYNTYPAFSTKTDRKGISVEEIIGAAMNESGKTLSSNAVITFTGNDGYSPKLTAGQLFADRYYYPNAASGTDNRGGAVKAAAYEGKQLVPAIIETGNKNTFLFGQTEPNEQNFTECVDGMLTIGQIDIDTSGNIEQCEAVSEAVPKDGSTVNIGQKIELPYPSDKNKRDKICYVIDPEEGEAPGLANGFYNYSAYRYYEKLTNPPVLNKPGKYVIKVKTIGYGKKDSDVTTLNYNVVLGNVTGFRAASSGYSSVILRWDRMTGAAGYEIYRKSGSIYKRIKTITSPEITSCKDTGLKTGTTYYYRIEAVSADKEGQPVKSDYVSASAKPVPSTPSVSLKAGSRKATVKWSKVSGASGYQVSRSLKKSSGFKTAKTVTSGSRTYYVNKRLKKGKTYYFKVRAYKKVSGKKIYGSYSTVKAVKVK